MAKSTPPSLTRREREIMDILYRREQLSAAEVLEEMADPPSYSAVRALLRLLEERGHITHREDGPRYVFRPTVARKEARRSALQHMVATFFGGSVEQAIANLVESSAQDLSEAELDRLEKMIAKAKKDGR